MRYGLVCILVLAAGALSAQAERRDFPPYQKAHWAWRPPARTAPPSVRQAAWVLNPVDAFVLARQKAAGLRPSPAASREELLRRAAFDLTGLPPTSEETDAFLGDRAPGAWERAVDRYLAAPAYGERWARLWLDLARYADTNGYEHDEIRPNAWRYRDSVVRAFNEDTPFDAFARRQIAGDLLEPESPDAVTATGILLLGPDMTDAADQGARRQNTLNDMTDTVGLVFLGLTLGCARCHDHKYEPLSQEDYFRFQAFFAGVQFEQARPLGNRLELAAWEVRRARHAAARKSLEAERQRIVGPVRDRLIREGIARMDEPIQTAFALPENERTADQQILLTRALKEVEPTAARLQAALNPEERARFQEVERRLKEHDGRAPAPPPAALAVREGEGPTPKTYVLARGEFGHRLHEVRPGAPTVLEPHLPLPAEGATPREALAAWIAHPRNPLTARVWVNRVWAALFGRGIVPTPSDFGIRGDAPSHPELLDWLAVTFAEPRERGGLGWSTKALLRLLLTSNSYKQSSRPPQDRIGKDPENRFFTRMARKRLEAEMIRDAGLAVSGRLSRRTGGPGIFPALAEGPPPGAPRWPTSTDPEDRTRRSLYIFVRRNFVFPDLELFDTPDTNLSCGRRESSTTAPQALALLNGAEAFDNARGLAGRVRAASPEPAGRIEAAYRIALGRRPTPAERTAALEFVHTQAVHHPSEVEEVWTDFCLALLNLNEFLYLD